MRHLHGDQRSHRQSDQRHRRRAYRLDQPNRILRVLQEILDPLPQPLFIAYVRGHKLPPAVLAFDIRGADSLRLFSIGDGGEKSVLLVNDQTRGGIWYMAHARAEYQVFLRFSELTARRMAVLISHRFSTVLMADRILVLQGGELVEHGTHEALVAQGGLYAELFHLQAAGYR